MSNWWDEMPKFNVPVGMRCAAVVSATGRVCMMRFDGEEWHEVTPAADELVRIAEWQAALDAVKPVPP